MVKEERVRLLTAVNEILKMHGLPRITAERLGEASKDEAEIVGLSDFRAGSDGSLEIMFRVSVPNLGEREIAVRFGGSGCVIIPLLSVSQNGEPCQAKVALVKKWRVENGDWSYELPRGRVTPDEHANLEDPDKSPVYRIISDTFGEECRQALDRAAVVNVGKLDQRGEAASLDIVFMSASITQDFLRRPGDGRIVLVPLDQLLKLLDDDLGKTTRVTEVVTTAALLKAARKLGW